MIPDLLKPVLPDQDRTCLIFQSGSILANGLILNLLPLLLSPVRIRNTILVGASVLVLRTYSRNFRPAKNTC